MAYEETVNEQEWNLCSENDLPESIQNCEYSELCLVWYAEIPNLKVAGYGIAYYNYSPPFKTKGEWVDFANYGRQPIGWTNIKPPPFANG